MERGDGRCTLPNREKYGAQSYELMDWDAYIEGLGPAAARNQIWQVLDAVTVKGQGGGAGQAHSRDLGIRKNSGHL